MKNIMKKTLAAVAMSATFVATIIPAKACTGVIVGPEISETGNFIFGRTEDLEVNHNKAYKLHEAGAHKKGEKLKDVSYDEEAGYEFELPHDSYHFTSVSDTTPEYGEFDEAGFNEKGVIADMTVSASANDKVLEKDPYVDDGDSIGISEAIITTVVLSTADTALDGVKLLADEVAVKGSAEGNALVIADKDSVWYMEIYTGHQFVAMKYPADKFSVFPNTFWLNECKLDKGSEEEHYNVSKDGNFIYSKDIFKVAEEAGTFKGDKENDIIDCVGSYNPEQYSLGNVSRAWSGIKHFNKNAKVDKDSKVYPFLQDADHKISLNEVFEFTRNRMENVGVTANDFGRSSDVVYPIGNRNTMESHIFETKTSNPYEVPGVMYLALGSPLVSPYVPYFPNQTSAIDQATNQSNDPTLDSVYWLALDTLYMVEVNRGEFMEVVNKHLSPAQKELIVEPNALSAEEATKLNLEKAKLGYEEMKACHDELVPLYEAFLKDNGYDSIFNARRKTKDFAGTVLSVEAATANKHLNLAISLEPTTLTIVDDYGNPVESLEKDVKITIPEAALGEGAEFEAEEGLNVSTELKDGLYTITTNSPKLTLKGEAPAESAAPAPAKNNSNPAMIWVVVGIIAVVAIVVAKNKKKDN